MKAPVVLLLAALMCLPACGSTGERKKKERPLLPGEEISTLPFNRPTRRSEMATPFGLDQR